MLILFQLTLNLSIEPTIPYQHFFISLLSDLLSLLSCFFTFDKYRNCEFRHYNPIVTRLFSSSSTRLLNRLTTNSTAAR